MLLLLAAGGVFLVTSRRRARRESEGDGRSEVGQINQQDDFVRLGDSIRALELDVTLGDGNAAAKADYDRAVEAYDRANAYNRQGATSAADEALDEGLAAHRRGPRAARGPPLEREVRGAAAAPGADQSMYS